MPLIFVIQLKNGALFLQTNFFLPNALSFATLLAVALAAGWLGASESLAVNIFLLTVIFSFTTTCALLKSHKSDLNNSNNDSNNNKKNHNENENDKWEWEWRWK